MILLPCPPSMSQESSKKRYRASVACMTCRKRRKRCLIYDSNTECDACQHGNLECIIRDTDQRKRPSSKAHIRALTERINTLETLLAFGGDAKDIIDVMTSKSLVQAEQAVAQEEPPVELSNGSYSAQGMQLLAVSKEEQAHSAPITPDDSDSPIQTLSKKVVLDRITFATGHVNISAAGRLQPLGPCSVFRPYSRPGQPLNVARVKLQRIRTQRFIREIPTQLTLHLMSTFWTCYNSNIRLVEKQTFMAAQEIGRDEYYSPFLHLCILAIGYRYADRTRSGMEELAVSNWESVFHREAKLIIDDELEMPTTVASVQALLLFADLEGGARRYHVGWIYAGVAARLCIELGIHLGCSVLDLCNGEIQSRQQTFWACVIQNSGWALFFGQPTTIKCSDIAELVVNYRLCLQRTSSTIESTGEKSEFLLYEASILLMDLASRIVNDVHLQPSRCLLSSYFSVVALHRELLRWYQELPECLGWTSHNIQQAPSTFFLLHQQYHAILILLYRPLCCCESLPSSAERDSDQRVDLVSEMSWKTCFDNAVRISQILMIYQEKFEVRTMYVTGIQHAIIAGEALAAYMEYNKDQKDALQYLQSLDEIFLSQSGWYFPAETGAQMVRSVTKSNWGDAVVGSNQPVPNEHLNFFRIPQSPRTVSHPRRLKRRQPTAASNPRTSFDMPTATEPDVAKKDPTAFKPGEATTQPTEALQTAPRSQADLPYVSSLALPEFILFPNERDILGLSPADNIFHHFTDEVGWQ